MRSLYYREIPVIMGYGNEFFNGIFLDDEIEEILSPLCDGPEKILKDQLEIEKVEEIEAARAAREEAEKSEQFWSKFDSTIVDGLLIFFVAVLLLKELYESV
jgi:hypothetical protein